MSWWIWVLVAFLLLTIEFFSTTMHIGFFAVGAFLVAILVGAGLAIPLWGQLLTFAITSVVALIFVRPIIVRKLGLSRTPVVDTMIGEEAIATVEIAAGAVGKAELRGSSWNARNVGETTLATGQRCTVERIDGLVLHVKAQ
jgi:membrane protein implicated in regulation of membrane protease activity